MYFPCFQISSYRPFLSAYFHPSLRIRLPRIDDNNEDSMAVSFSAPTHAISVGSCRFLVYSCDGYDGFWHARSLELGIEFRQSTANILKGCVQIESMRQETANYSR